jgi:outer membrane biosynthesis protein TonB
MKKGIYIAVIGTHVALVIMMAISSTITPLKKKSKALVVRTVTPKSTATLKPVAASPPSATPQEKASPIPAPAPPSKMPTPKTPPPVKKTPPKQEIPKKAAPSTPKAQAKPVPAKKPIIAQKKKEVEPAAPKIPKKLLQELEESIAIIDGKRDKIAPLKKLEAPKSLESIHSDPQKEEDTLLTLVDDTSYQETLVSYLHQALNLPEHGEVKIELTLRRDGTVANLIVLKTESEKNKSYLEKSLPHLKFPILDGMFSNKNLQTFILTFCNEL